MKKTIALLFTLLALMAVLASAQTTWTGWVTDEHCGAKGASADHKACAEKCLTQGSKLVFYSTGDKKIYSLDKQDLAKDNLGQEVRVTGVLDGKTIKVESISPARAGQ
jgi:tRNA isopentenyl-2-thiomethyl-A-37 hydroxylase MiaE